jgi:hypothetical protein
MLIEVLQLQSARNLDQATTQLLNELKKGTPAMQTIRSRVQTRVDGRAALLSELANDSPAGGQETDFVITVMRSNNELLYFVLAAPAKEMERYRTAFNMVMDSVRLR